MRELILFFVVLSLVGCSTIKRSSNRHSAQPVCAVLLSDSVIPASEENNQPIKPLLSKDKMNNYVPLPEEWTQSIAFWLRSDSLFVSIKHRSFAFDSVLVQLSRDTLFLDFEYVSSEIAWHQTNICVAQLSFPMSAYLPIRFCGKNVLPIISTADTIRYPLLETPWGDGAEKCIIGEWQEWKRVETGWNEKHHNYDWYWGFTKNLYTFNSDGTWYVVAKNKIVKCGIFHQYKQKHWYRLASRNMPYLLLCEEDVYTVPEFCPKDYFDIYDEAASPYGSTIANRLILYCSKSNLSDCAFFRADDSHMFFSSFAFKEVYRIFTKK